MSFFKEVLFLANIECCPKFLEYALVCGVVLYYLTKEIIGFFLTEKFQVIKNVEKNYKIFKIQNILIIYASLTIFIYIILYCCFQYYIFSCSRGYDFSSFLSCGFLQFDSHSFLISSFSIKSFFKFI